MLQHQGVRQGEILAYQSHYAGTASTPEDAGARHYENLPMQYTEIFSQEKIWNFIQQKNDT